MQISRRALNRFSLDFSRLSPSITRSGLRNIEIAGKERNVEGYRTKNFDSGHLHTVIMIHEWWGLNESITRTAEVFATDKIRVFVPDLFRDEAANSAEEAGHKMNNLNWPNALDDLAAIKSHLEKSSQSVSILGFCMGGALTIASLASIAGWKAGGVFYGIPDLNIFRLDKIKAKSVAHFGALDPLIGFSDIESAKRLKQDCEDNKYPLDVQIYDEASHAFCNQDGLYFDQNARDTAFKLTRDLIEA